ncbi:MAG: hypothetical protein SOR61_07280 [Evtepia sp.]|uniref:hypothetical protein n=1 Tax=Evtepia sp. TaxID=2773933 RepID=UPI002A752B81|nr:hypothetical protein [Evtepia sp.]MDY3014966.1 hypothetical protein [Evtepia sp.]
MYDKYVRNELGNKRLVDIKYSTIKKFYNSLLENGFDFTLKPGQTIKIPTGIRVKIDDGWWLGGFPRSGLGFKYRFQLDNTIPVIDSDYYGSDNEGHIFIKATNDTKENKTIEIHAGDKFVQGIFIPYGITYSDNVDNVRNGGMGSTDTKENVL